VDGTLKRETPSDVVLVSRLRAALERLNAGRIGQQFRPCLPEVASKVDGGSMGGAVGTVEFQ